MKSDYVQKGREWVEHHILNQELFHYGVKGMKWGVRNKRHNILKVRNTLIEDEIRSGRVSKNINKDKQERHTKDGHVPGRSYINGDVRYAQKLVNSLSGTGTPIVSRNGEWTHRERVESSYTIGTHVDSNGKQTVTNKAMIVYSKSGSHIYPRKED